MISNVKQTDKCCFSFERSVDVIVVIGRRIKLKTRQYLLIHKIQKNFTFFTQLQTVLGKWLVGWLVIDLLFTGIIVSSQ